MPMAIFRQSLDRPTSLAAKYKMFNTGGNNPQISTRMKYAHYVQNINRNQYPILQIRNANVEDPTIQCVHKIQTYLPTNSTLQINNQSFCIARANSHP